MGEIILWGGQAKKNEGGYEKVMGERREGEKEEPENSG